MTGQEKERGLSWRNVLRTTAALLAGTLLVTGGVAAGANAQERVIWREGGGLVVPNSDSLSGVTDTGVATYVGRDMHVGMISSEAEGTTIVGGRLQFDDLRHNGGNAWHGAGFRFGYAGLGSEYLPANGSVALVIADGDTAIEGEYATGGTYLTYNAGAGPLGAVGAGFVGASQTDDRWYRARLAGSNGQVDTARSGVRVPALIGDSGGERPDLVEEQVDDPLADVNGTDARGLLDQARAMSKTLAALKDTGRVDVSVAPADDDYWRHNYYDPQGVNYKFVFTGEDRPAYAERLVTFTGDGQSAMQVFTLDAAQLDTDGWHGLDFAFDSIPEGASVVVNVTGDTVGFEHGWRTWFNGTEIGDAWAQDENSDVRKAFTTAARSVLWNFPDATEVRVNGGRLNEGDWRDREGRRWGDPAAELVGSILVPQGDVVTEVSTNGRVIAGRDYVMAASPGRDMGSEAYSVLGMVQERHNFPWNGDATYRAGGIRWAKTDTAGMPLAGSVWGVYASLEEARRASGALMVVEDNGEHDLDGEPGALRVGNLKAGHDYFVRELVAPSGYSMARDVYAAAVDDENSVAGLVPTSGGDTVGGVVNERATRVAFTKYDGHGAAGDEAAALAGSQWTLADTHGNTADLRDATVAASGISVKAAEGDLPDGGLDLLVGEGAQLHATVTPDDAPRSVAWTSTDTKIASVDQGMVNALAVGETSITVASMADPSITASVPVRVHGTWNPRAGDTVLKNGEAVVLTPGEHDLSMVDGERVFAGRTPSLSSSDMDVVRVKDGRLVAGTRGAATVTWTVAGRTCSATVHVIPGDVTAVYTRASLGGPTLYVDEPDANMDVICHDEGKNGAPSCTTQLMDTDWESHLVGESDTLGDEWVVTYVPNGKLEAFDFVIGASVGRYEWNNGQSHSVEIKASMRATDYKNFQVPAGVRAYRVDSYDRHREGAPTGCANLPGDLHVTDPDGKRIATGHAVSVMTGDSEQFHARVSVDGEDADGRVYWKSTDPNVVSVDDTGLMRGVKAGSAVICALTPGGQGIRITVHVVDADRIAIFFRERHRAPVYALRDNTVAQRRPSGMSDEQWAARDAHTLSDVQMDGWEHPFWAGWGEDVEAVRRVDIPASVAAANRYLIYRTEPENSSSIGLVSVGATYVDLAEAEAGRAYFGNPVDGRQAAQPGFNRSGLEDLGNNSVRYAGDLPGLSDEERASIVTPPRPAPSTPVSSRQVNPVEDVDPRPGFFHLEGLTDGEYTLIETTAPEGYVKLETPVRFTVKAGQVFWPEGVPVVDQVAWLANRKPQAPDTPDAPASDGENKAPRPTGTADASEPAKPDGLASTGTSVSVVGLAVMVAVTLAAIMILVASRRHHGRHRA
ncbi:MAG: choice-of-anchor A family protein [Bifidobacterium animalis]|nr:choice-of-anchor A family protein [Bifidobacterium animalis]